MSHLYKVYPRTDISGILPNNKRISEPTVLKLNKQEFIRCMNYGEVYALVNDTEILIKDIDYDKAESLFVSKVLSDSKSITNEVKIEDSNNKITEESVVPNEEFDNVIDEKEKNSCDIKNEDVEDVNLVNQSYESNIESEEPDKSFEKEENEEIVTQVPKSNNKIYNDKHNNKNQKAKYQSSSKKNIRSGYNK